ncbi:MAG: hypothetical protein IKU41_00740 [Clostridia bacterium]|nr:hypothetical protein [Clostridia bacterium]
MTDSRTLAYINMYAVLGTLENLCELDDKAKEILSTIEKPISVAFDVKNGPSATLTFSKNGCRMDDGVNADCDIKIPVANCDKFNGIIDGKVTPIPTKGLTKVNFLLKTFTALTDRLTEVMRPSEEALKDMDFFRLNTLCTFYTVAVAISQIGNQDAIGKFSASNVVDGDIQIGITGEVYATIRVKDHHMITIKQAPEKPRAIMEFCDIPLANALFAGTVNSIDHVGNGNITIRGLISMVDNVNRILDRVGLYLA